MANKQISDLQARTFDGDSIIPHDVENTDPSTMSQKPYLTGSATGHAVADFVGNGEIYTTDLDTVDKHINGAINELHAINGYSYDAYDDTATYAVGDLCIYNNALYKCTTAITTAEAWNASHWTATSIADEISEVKSGSEYQVGDTINISNIQCVGTLTSGQKAIYIQIPLSKPISNSVSSITVNPNSLWYIRHASGGYIMNNQTISSVGTITTNKNVIGVFVGIDLTNAFTSAPNNSPLVISLGNDNNNTITFS